MRRVVIPLALMGLALGCASSDQRMESYVGQDIQTVIERNGLPSQTMELSNGNTAYEYRYRGDVVIQRVGSSSHPRPADCITGFETDEYGTILRYYSRSETVLPSLLGCDRHRAIVALE